MTESDRIAEAEQELRDTLGRAGEPVSAEELASALSDAISRSLVRLALQRMIARGIVEYDPQRRYSLREAASQSA